MSINDRSVSAPDGTQISYSVEGTGPALVLTNGLTTTTHFWKYLRPRWLEQYKVVTWDFPGHGRSAPAATPQGATLDAQPGILARVMDAAGVERAVHVGFSVGCQVIFEMYRAFPERCEALVALLGTAGRALTSTTFPLGGTTLSNLFHELPTLAFWPFFRGLAWTANLPGSFRLGRHLGLVGSASDDDVAFVTQHLRTLDPVTMQIMACSAESHSADDVLRSLRIPLLIVAGDKDPFAPADTVGVAMHEAARDSELVRLPEGTHTALLDHPDEIAAAMEGFLSRRLSTVVG